MFTATLLESDEPSAAGSGTWKPALATGGSDFTPRTPQCSGIVKATMPVAATILNSTVSAAAWTLTTTSPSCAGAVGGGPAGAGAGSLQAAPVQARATAAAAARIRVMTNPRL